jgi:hypothetical protein
MTETWPPLMLYSLISTLVEAASFKTFSLLKVISVPLLPFVVSRSPTAMESPIRTGLADFMPDFKISTLPFI